MNEPEFSDLLLEALRENLSLSLSCGRSYGYGDEDKVLIVHLKFRNQTICNEEICIR